MTAIIARRSAALADRYRIERHLDAWCRRVANTKPSLPLAAYAGTYTDSLYGAW